MSKRILMGHNALRGDLCINLPAIQWLHRHDPDWIVDMPIHRPLADMAPLFFNLPYLNSTIITEAHDGFPSSRDLDLLRHRAYDLVGNPMQPHADDRWHQRIHQTAVVLEDYFQQPLPRDEQQIELVRWFDPITTSTHFYSKGKMLAFAPFAGYASNKTNDKMVSVARAQEIVNYVLSKGYGIVQLGGSDEPRLNGATQLEGVDYFYSVRVMLGCKALIHTDTGMGWVASGYKHPQLGLYGHRYYGVDHVDNIQPRNPNAMFLDAPTVADIPLDKITQAIDNLLS